MGLDLHRNKPVGKVEIEVNEQEGEEIKDA
jgi:hypothetical protein